VRRVHGPFALAVTETAVDPGELWRLGALFVQPAPWVRHQDHFYRCFIAEVDGHLPAPMVARLRGRVGAVLGLDLADPVRVTAQRMEAGDGSDRHTDRPRAGYEAARLVVQLDRDVGGHFRAFDGPRVWVDRAPQPNGGVALALSDRSAHDVTVCTATRRTVVFHFWERDNPPAASRVVDDLLGSMSFAELPRALDPVMTAAEALHDDAHTHRAGSVASLLHGWGSDPDALLAAYRAAISGAAATSDTDALARWLVTLFVDGFDRVGLAALPNSARVQWRRLLDAAEHPVASSGKVPPRRP